MARFTQRIVEVSRTPGHEVAGGRARSPIQGDARVGLGALEVAAELAARDRGAEIEAVHVAEATQRKALRYDRKGEEHFFATRPPP